MTESEQQNPTSIWNPGKLDSRHMPCPQSVSAPQRRPPVLRKHRPLVCDCDSETRFLSTWRLGRPTHWPAGSIRTGMLPLASKWVRTPGGARSLSPAQARGPRTVLALKCHLRSGSTFHEFAIAIHNAFGHRIRWGQRVFLVGRETSRLGKATNSHFRAVHSPGGVSGFLMTPKLSGNGATCFVRWIWHCVVPWELSNGTCWGVGTWASRSGRVCEKQFDGRRASAGPLTISDRKHSATISRYVSERGR